MPRSIEIRTRAGIQSTHSPPRANPIDVRAQQAFSSQLQTRARIEARRSASRTQTGADILRTAIAQDGLDETTIQRSGRRATASILTSAWRRDGACWVRCLLRETKRNKEGCGKAVHYLDLATQQRDRSCDVRRATQVRRTSYNDTSTWHVLLWSHQTRGSAGARIRRSGRSIPGPSSAYNHPHQLPSFLSYTHGHPAFR